MTTLVLSTWTLPASHALADAAKKIGWQVQLIDPSAATHIDGAVVFYGGTDLARAIAARLDLILIEPPLDLLARLPSEFLLRRVEFATFGDLRRLRTPTFVKPADAMDKAFDPGIYSSVRDIRTIKDVSDDFPVLLAEPVEWSAEYRCFIAEGAIVAWSPYLSFGRPIWKPHPGAGRSLAVPHNLSAFCGRLFAKSSNRFPPSFVMDVGAIEDRGWAVVEFNPTWCSGVLGADPRQVLKALQRASTPSVR